MRAIFLTFWLALPLGVLAYHYGPGQERLQLDHVHDHLAVGRDHAAAGRHAEAAAAFEEALRLLPPGHEREARPIRVERARAWMETSRLPDAREDLGALMAELEQEPAADPELVASARRALASAAYYTTWLMRLEGLEREVWEPEIEVARQHYRLLAEEATGEPERARAATDLAAAIRLARMDLTELQGLPLPNQ